jgi:pimeloyl-ACP methyl ester carboxylesterase
MEPTDSPVPGISLEMVTLGTGVTLRVASAGPASGVPVLFMHGWPESWYSWRHQLKALGAAGFHAIAPDMRGYGHSDCPPASSDYNCHAIAADMIGLLQAFGMNKAVLIGHDWGAALTWLVGALHPTWFPVLAALSVPTGVRLASSELPIARLKSAFGEGPDGNFFYQLYHNELFGGSANSGPAEAEYDADPYETIFRVWSDNTVPKAELLSPRTQKRRDGGMFARAGIPQHLPAWLTSDDLDYVAEQFKVSGFRGGVSYYRNIDRNYQLTPHLVGQTISQPCMFLTGEHDVVASFSPGGLEAQKTAVAQACPDLRGHHVIKASEGMTAGHWIQQERPQEVNEILIQFLRGTAADFSQASGAATSKL